MDSQIIIEIRKPVVAMLLLPAIKSGAYWWYQITVSGTTGYVATHHILWDIYQSASAIADDIYDSRHDADNQTLLDIMLNGEDDAA